MACTVLSRNDRYYVKEESRTRRRTPINIRDIMLFVHIVVCSVYSVVSNGIYPVLEWMLVLTQFRLTTHICIVFPVAPGNVTGAQDDD